MDLTQQGKDKAARLSLDYHRPAGHVRRVAAWIAAGATVLVIGAATFSGCWRTAASPGPIHAVHAAWESDCAACHAPFQPTTSSNALRERGLGKSADELCVKCHSGPPHHGDREIAGESGSCSSCHLEHRGRHSTLRQPPDSACTKCHSALHKHVVDHEPHFAKSITRFDRDHPDFQFGPLNQRRPREQASDPGMVRFNHWLHLLPGQRATKGDVGRNLADIADLKLRERYRSQQPDDQRDDRQPIQLSCASCHQLDSSASRSEVSGETPLPRSTGDYMLPVSYAQHCQGCHPLTFGAGKSEIPHRVQPEDVHLFLWGALAGLEIKQLTGSNRPLPGDNLSLLDRQARKRLDDKADRLLEILSQSSLGKEEHVIFGGSTTCGLCHYFERSAGRAIPSHIVPTDVPAVWLPHAQFSHRPHQMMECVDCHEKAATSTDHNQVLLPGTGTAAIDNCKSCHAPANRSDGVQHGGVRFDCVACHRYHGRGD